MSAAPAYVQFSKGGKQMLTKEENDYLAESAKWDVKIGAIYISSSVTMERE